jgi:raffinose/stachyose/melibiose transport system permease protein
MTGIYRPRQEVKKARLRKMRFAILFSLPAFVVYLFFLIIPMIGTFYYSTIHWSGFTNKVFVGLQNFKILFSSREFWWILYNTFVLIGFHLIVQLPLAFGLSYLLYRTRQGFRAFRAILFLPTIISATVVGLMFAIMLNGDVGPVNKILHTIELGSLARNWLADKTLVLNSVSMVIVWQYIGYQMAIILAGMQGIPEEIIESAIIDGASSIRLFFNIILPMIKGTIQVSLIVLITGCLKAFEHSYIMTWGGPGTASTYLTVYMYKLAYLKNDMGGGSAIGVVIIVIALLSIQIMNKLFYGKNKELL